MPSVCSSQSNVFRIEEKTRRKIRNMKLHKRLHQRVEFKNKIFPHRTHLNPPEWLMLSNYIYDSRAPRCLCSLHEIFSNSTWHQKIRRRRFSVYAKREFSAKRRRKIVFKILVIKRNVPWSNVSGSKFRSFCLNIFSVNSFFAKFQHQTVIVMFSLSFVRMKWHLVKHKLRHNKSSAHLHWSKESVDWSERCLMRCQSTKQKKHLTQFTNSRAFEVLLAEVSAPCC